MGIKSTSIKLFIAFFVAFSFVALFTCVVLFTMAVFFQDCRVCKCKVIQSQIQKSGSNFEGEWKTGGPKRLLTVGAPCRIYTDGDSLYVMNEKGATVKATLLDTETIITEESYGRLVGYTSDDGRRINWANGTWWIR